MKFILKVDGTTVDMLANGLRFNAIQTFSVSGQPRLSMFMVTNIVPSPAAVFSPSNPWTYNGKTVEVIATSDDDLTEKVVFYGDVVLVDPSYRGDTVNGYSIEAIGYGDRAERIPVINPIDLTTAITINPESTSYNYDSIYDGMNLGEAVAFVLKGYDIASRLEAAGFTGMYSDVGSESLPATLVANLQSELDEIDARPITPIYVGGDNLFGAIQSMIESYDPNYGVIADPDERRFKFFDLRKTNDRNFVLGEDLIAAFRPSRDTSSSYRRVVIRGSPDVRPHIAHWNYGADAGYPEGIKRGNLIEAFAYGGLDNAAAKAAWSLNDFEKHVVVKGDSNGITWPSTQPDEVLLNPASFSVNPETSIGVTPLAWAEDEWGQTAVPPDIARQGRITIKRQFRWAGAPGALSAGDIVWSIEDRFRVVANDAYTLGDVGPVSFTLDRPHGVTLSDIDPPDDITGTPGDYEEEWNFELVGYNPSGANVWRTYQITFGEDQQGSGEAGITRKIMNWFPEPQAWRSGDGLSTFLVTTPQAAIVWSNNYEAPFSEWPIGFYLDREQNKITFTPPVVRLFGTYDSLVAGGFDDAITPPWGVITDGVTNQLIDGVPYDIKVLLPVAYGVLTATYPDVDAEITDTLPGGAFVYGTATRYDGVTRTMEVGLPQWVKKTDQAFMDTYAAKIYDSVKDTVVRGSCEHITLIDPFEESWNPYWLGEESYLEGEVTKYRPLIPAFTVSMLDSVVCDSGCPVLPEEKLIIRLTEIRFSEGAGGKAACVAMQYSNQKAPWVSPETGLDFYKQMITTELMDYQLTRGPV